MDKHERKQLSRWETKKAKDQLRFEEYLRQHSHEMAWRKIEHAVQNYTPPQGIVFSRARALASTFESRWDRIPLWWDIEGGFHMMYSRRIRLFVSDEEIAVEIAERKAEKQGRQTERVACALLRHKYRVNAIREELLVKTNRLRAIQNCRNGFKEELMMKVWHPSRVMKFIETYGEDAFDNLIGVNYKIKTDP